jgi:hypothetical protein
MRTILALAAVAAIGAAGAAYATDRTTDKTNKLQDRAISAEQMKAKVDSLGYDVDRMKKDNGAYKARLTDRDSGGKVNVRFDGKTGALTGAKLAREEHERGEREAAREHGKAPAQKAEMEKERHEERDEHREDRD